MALYRGTLQIKKNKGPLSQYLKKWSVLVFCTCRAIQRRGTPLPIFQIIVATPKSKQTKGIKKRFGRLKSHFENKKKNDE